MEAQVKVDLQNTTAAEWEKWQSYIKQVTQEPENPPVNYRQYLTKP